ncbi:helix-turn-helix domain-containing protein [Paenibacillus sp. LK1]|uniref:helix-turn-helix domain-containing protein n=1 Tax=Paenibacillus sp. LK1 TaxID=2053014 RepID=UPI0015D4A8D4|nr:helix-turn-helix domain-containing protein [Paenibacillus sp. LK1]
MQTFSLNNQLGNLLKELRTQKKWSLRKAAEVSGVSHTYINNLEKGIAANVSPEQIKKLANAYGHSYNVLMILAGYKDETEPVKYSELSNEMQEIFGEDYFSTEEYYESLKHVVIHEPVEEWIIPSELNVKTFGDRLKFLRVKANLSINQLSKIIVGEHIKAGFTVFKKYPPFLIESIENDEEEPTLSFIIAVSDYFDVSANWLVDGEEDKLNEDKKSLDINEYRIEMEKLAKEIILDETINRLLDKKINESKVSLNGENY